MEYISKDYLLKTYEKERQGMAISFRKIIEEAPTITITGDVRALLAHTIDELEDTKHGSGLLTED